MPWTFLLQHFHVTWNINLTQFSTSCIDADDIIVACTAVITSSLRAATLLAVSILSIWGWILEIWNFQRAIPTCWTRFQGRLQNSGSILCLVNDQLGLSRHFGTDQAHRKPVFSQTETRKICQLVVSWSTTSHLDWLDWWNVTLTAMSSLNNLSKCLKTQYRATEGSAKWRGAHHTVSVSKNSMILLTSVCFVRAIGLSIAVLDRDVCIQTYTCLQMHYLANCNYWQYYKTSLSNKRCCNVSNDNQLLTSSS